MKVRIPHFMVDAWDALGDWTNVPIWRRGRIEIRRIDIILALGFIGCVTYYWLVSGWMAALQGGVMYLFIGAMAIWLF